MIESVVVARLEHNKLRVCHVNTDNGSTMFGEITPPFTSKIHGVECMGNKVSFTNGAEDRYCFMYSTGINKYSRYLVIIAQDDKNNYIVYVTDSQSHAIRVVPVQYIIEFARNEKSIVSNAKVIDTADKGYISPIKGEFIQIERNGVTRNGKVETLDRRGETSVYTEGSGQSSDGARAKGVGADSSSYIPKGRNSRPEGDRADREFMRLNTHMRHNGYKIVLNSANVYESPHTFRKDIESAKELNAHGACVDTHTIQEYYRMNCISFDEGRAGVAVKSDGDIVSLFKCPTSEIHGFLKFGIAKAIEYGGKKLDCYNISREGLPYKYSMCGFIPVCRIKFNREFAPDGWNYERDGEPDIVFMAYCGDDIMTMLDNYGMYNEYTQAVINNEIPLIEDRDGVDAYTRAAQYRDNWMRENIVDTKTKKQGWFSKILRKVLGDDFER